MFNEDTFFSNAADEEVDFLPIVSIEEDDEKKEVVMDDTINILPLKNTVLFPGVIIPITVGRKKSIQAIKDAYKTKSLIGVVSQKGDKIEDPTPSDLHTIGTLARIVRILKMPDGSNTVIIQGKKRFTINEIISTTPYIKATGSVLDDNSPKRDKEFNALISNINEMAKNIIQLSPNIPNEANFILKNIQSPVFLINFIASNLNIEVLEKQAILENENVKERANKVLTLMNKELQHLELKDQIHHKVQTEIDDQQRQFFLHQQLKTIQEELGVNSDSAIHDIEELEKKAAKKKWNEPVKKAFHKELSRLKRMNPMMPDYSVNLNYLELLLDLPWGEYTKDKFDLKRAKKVLDREHFGLEKIKERILEYLAVLKLKGDMKSPILCLVGPPGVGKTSLGKSIAEALDRKYIRMSLGGLHDESEIRGHRKTYIGAQPGRVVQSIKKSKSSNPVFILDEIDKIGNDFRGDPSSALLEVLDPEQNATFYDNYLELEYDLSKIMFIATANSLSSIQPALLDRMEIIHVSGYSVEEKVEIAKKHLVPKQRKAHGLKQTDVKISPSILKELVQYYTRESGVRELDRQVASVMRSVAKAVAMEDSYNISVQKEDLKVYLGPEKYDKEVYERAKIPGVVVGLAWTQVGGDILFIESSLSPGKGKLTLTGSLGDVMKESATTALSFIKANHEQLGIDNEDFTKHDLHIHVPEGATPKDGPSAGITMLTAVTSAFTKKQVRPYLAMTGEITLRGKVLPVGGIKEKILAAKRSGVKEIILCKTNQKDIEEIEERYLKGLTFHYVTDMMEVLKLALS